MPPGEWLHGARFTTLLADCRRFLPWATRRFLVAGGRLQQRSVGALADLFDDSDAMYAAVFNCSGLGARKLCADTRLVPIRGQVLRVHAPWLRTAFYDDFDTYVIPGFDGEVILGGVRHYDSHSVEPDRHDRAGILERCERLCPGVAAAPVRREQVGLRPHRSEVRVECEVWPATPPPLVADGRRLVVHNYGHGGYGVSTSPGTARQAVQLARDALMRNAQQRGE